MADPRETNPTMRKSNHSPLMQALCSQGQGEVANFCPFGCEAHELDDKGWCSHLIGFYNGGQTFEPRIKRKDHRVITSGKAREPMKRGYKLVRITTTARVYSPEPRKHLAVQRDDAERVQNDILERERLLMEAAEKIRNPVLDGEWDGDYERVSAPAATAAAG